jgi:hypothetical protein
LYFAYVFQLRGIRLLGNPNDYKLRHISFTHPVEITNTTTVAEKQSVLVSVIITGSNTECLLQKLPLNRTIIVRQATWYTGGEKKVKNTLMKNTYCEFISSETNISSHLWYNWGKGDTYYQTCYATDFNSTKKMITDSLYSAKLQSKDWRQPGSEISNLLDLNLQFNKLGGIQPPYENIWPGYDPCKSDESLCSDTVIKKDLRAAYERYSLKSTATSKEIDGAWKSQTWLISSLYIRLRKCISYAYRCKEAIIHRIEEEEQHWTKAEDTRKLAEIMMESAKQKYNKTLEDIASRNLDEKQKQTEIESAKDLLNIANIKFLEEQERIFEFAAQGNAAKSAIKHLTKTAVAQSYAKLIYQFKIGLKGGHIFCESNDIKDFSGTVVTYQPDYNIKMKKQFSDTCGLLVNTSGETKQFFQFPILPNGRKICAKISSHDNLLSSRRYLLNNTFVCPVVLYLG